MHTQSSPAGSPNIVVRPLSESDLDAADRTFRVAFGTFIGLPDPAAFAGDAQYVQPRWRTDPAAAFGAWIGDDFAGSNFATHWGSVGFFGPLTVRPDLWGSGVGKRLMEPVVERFDAWGTKSAGLFTFPHSLKHIGLYRRFGFHPRFLTALMGKPVAAGSAPATQWTRMSQVPAADRESTLRACRELTDAVYEGLDLTSEIRAVADQQLGETVLIWRGDRLAGLAACHAGPGSEGGSAGCYVKFGAVRPGPHAADDFDRLVSACEAFAAERGSPRVVAGVNTARHEAYEQMLARGFRTEMHGIVMQRPNDPGYNRPGTYLIDDWR